MNGYVGKLNGIDVFASLQFRDGIVSVRIKTHRKKRINKKWLKKYGYKDKVIEFKTYVFDNYGTKQMFMHPLVFENWKKKVNIVE